MFFKKQARVENPYPVPSKKKSVGFASALEEMADRGSFGSIGTHNPFSGERDNGAKAAYNGRMTDFGNELTGQFRDPGRLKKDRLFGW